MRRAGVTWRAFTSTPRSAGPDLVTEPRPGAWSPDHVTSRVKVGREAGNLSTCEVTRKLKGAGLLPAADVQRARAHRGHLPGQARFMCMRSKGRIIADCTWILNCWSILKFCSIFTNLQLVLHLLTINFTKFHDYSHFNTLIKKLTMFGIFKFPTVFLDSHEIHQIIPFLLKISRFSNVFAAKLPDFCKIYFWIFAENRRL